MRCLGLIGAPGVEFATHCSRLIDGEVRHRFGTDRCANIVALSLRTGALKSHLCANDRHGVARSIKASARVLVSLGAEAIFLCSSSLHVASGEVTDLPVLSITAPVVGAVRCSRFQRLGLIGTRGVEEELLWRSAFADEGIADVLLPVPRDRSHLVALADGEFSSGMVTEVARADVVRIVLSLRQAGARAVVICMPELSAVLQETAPLLPMLDAIEIYAHWAVDWMTAPTTSTCGQI